MIIREVLGCDTQVCKGFSRVLEVGINSIKPVSVFGHDLLTQNLSKKN